MADVQLKKKVQLKQKSANPTITLKRKGGATPVVLLNEKKPGNSAGVATAATTAAQAASTATTPTGKMHPVAGEKPAAVVKPVKGPAKAATGANGAGSTNSNGEIKAAGKTNPSGPNGGDKKRGKALAWILGAAAIAVLAFGGYKFATDNSGKTPSNMVADNTASGEKNIGEEYATDEAISQSGAGMTGEDVSTANITDGGVANCNDAQSPDGSSNTFGGNESTAGGHDSTTGNEVNSCPTNREVSASGTDNTTGNASQSSDTRGNNSKGSSIGGNSSAMIGNSGEKKSASSNDGVGPSATKKSSDVNSITSDHAVVKSVSESQAVCLFAFDSSIVGENDTLYRLANLAKASDKKIVINAYTDEVGADEYNQALSQRRANAVKDYFVKRGVNAVIISAKGNGETTRYATRAENRRADITIL